MLNSAKLLSKIFLTVFLIITIFILKPVTSHAAQQDQVWKLEYASIRCGIYDADSFHKNYNFNTTGDQPPLNPVPADEKIRLPFIASDKLQTCRLRLEFRYLRHSDWSYWQRNWNLDEDLGAHPERGGKVELRPYKAEVKTILRRDLAAENISVSYEDKLITGKSPTGYWMYLEMPLIKLFPKSENETNKKLENPNVVSPDVLKDKQSSLKIYISHPQYGKNNFTLHSGRIFLTLPAYKLDKSIQNNIQIN